MKAGQENKITYSKALDYLNQFQFHGFRLGLERIEAILKALGNPHKAYPSIHIAGTNGKGSTCAFLSSILTQAGLKVGLYTSPHLFSLTERFQINQRNIEEQTLAELIYYIKSFVEKGFELSYFEYTTAIAMKWFAQQKVDIAIFETGLGGRLDATNVIEPEVSIITNISLDHQSYLGKTIPEIAKEKAGIIKPHRPVVSSVLTPEAAEVMEKQCMALNAPLYKIDRDFFVQSLDVMHMDYKGLEVTLNKAQLGLLGEHQAVNSSLAVVCSELLRQAGWDITLHHIKDGLAKSAWPGRGELLQGKCPVLLDGAHNMDGIIKLKKLLSGLEGLNILGSSHKKLLLWACSNEGGDKNYSGMLNKLACDFDTIIITEPPGPRNPVKIEEWQEVIEKLPKKTLVIKEWSKGLDKAVELATKKDLLGIAGSLYLVGAARKKLFDNGWEKWLLKK